MYHISVISTTKYPYKQRQLTRRDGFVIMWAMKEEHERTPENDESFHP